MPLLHEIPEPELRARLARDGVLLPIGPFAVRIGTRLPELVAPIRLLYAEFEPIDEDTIEDFDVRAEPASRLPFSRWAVTRIDGKVRGKAFRRPLALPMLEWTLNWCVFTRPQHCLVLHSAVVESAGRAVILSGEAGAGKSTLATALSTRGFRLLSDEVAMFPGASRRSREVIPVPLPMSLKNESIARMSEFAPELTIGPAVEGTRKGTVAHVRPPTESVRRSNDPAEPVAVVFPRYERGAGCRFDPVNRGEALLRLADESFNYSVLGTSGFETLAAAVEGSRCFDLRYDDLDAAIEEIRRL